MNPSELAEMLKVLSAEMRVRIMVILQGRRLCAGAISRELGASPSSTSQHLKILKAAGLFPPPHRMEMTELPQVSAAKTAMERSDHVYQGRKQLRAS